MEKKEFYVSMTESFKRVITVEAENEEEALAIAQKKFKAEIATTKIIGVCYKIEDEEERNYHCTKI